MTVPTAASVLEQLAVRNAPVLSLLALCRKDEHLHLWSQGPDLFRRFAQLLLKQGHPTLALEVASRGLDKHCYPEDNELRYSRALALARSGNPTRADAFVKELLARPGLPVQLRSDALSLAGRVRKDAGTRTPDPAARTALFRKALAYYRQAYDLSKDTFPCINAATLALLAQQPSVARPLAEHVRDSVLDDLNNPGKDRDYWLLATLGEAYLLLGDFTAAKERYTQAVQLAREAHNHGDIASMFRQLQLLSDVLPIKEDLLGLFHLGPVVVFAGHGIDRPGEPYRFPNDPALEAAVRRAIKNHLDALQTQIGYCSPGCGSDILFGELMHKRDAELHVVLPFAEDDFVEQRLTFGLEEMQGWKTRYDALRGYLRVTRHSATTEKFLNDQALYDFAGTVMQGLALTRAAQVGAKAIALVVADLEAKEESIGLTKFIDNWKATGNELRVINLAEVKRNTPLATMIPPAPSKRPLLEEHRTVQAMLFADVAGFSGLPEEKLPDFFIKFLGEVHQQLVVTPALFQNTWGDGLYLVFEGVAPCAAFALGLLRRLRTFNFESFQFPLKEDKKPGVRIGLHTGPVFKSYDAVIGRDNYFGSHVSRAARIEPVTAPGCAFVSEQFAAALALEPGHEFFCEYLGLQPLAKDYDVCPLYRLTTNTNQEEFD